MANAFSRENDLPLRVGIRIRVPEYPTRSRKPNRMWRELHHVVKSVIRMPWYTRVFVVTDSEYIQQSLASHFFDTVFLRKRFELEEATGRYVSRRDKPAMLAFLQEVECLCRCKQIVNIGGFLNDRSVKHKLIQEPYAEADKLHLARFTDGRHCA